MRVKIKIDTNAHILVKHLNLNSSMFSSTVIIMYRLISGKKISTNRCNFKYFLIIAYLLCLLKLIKELLFFKLFHFITLKKLRKQKNFSKQ